MNLGNRVLKFSNSRVYPDPRTRVKTLTGYLKFMAVNLNEHDDNISYLQLMFVS